MDFLQAKDIEAKVGTVTENGCQLLLYKTARVDMAMLDKLYGAMNWQCDYKLIRDNMYCGIGVRDDKDQWVWKWDCGVESREDDNGNEKKGEASDAFKRAGFKWGIGVELYNTPFIWLNLETYAEEKNGKTFWKLKDKFVKFTVKEVAFDENGEFTNLVITDKKGMVVYELGKKIDSKTGLTPAEKAKATREENTEKKAEIEKRIDAGIKHFTGTPNGQQERISISVLETCVDLIAKGRQCKASNVIEFSDIVCEKAKHYAETATADLTAKETNLIDSLIKEVASLDSSLLSGNELAKVMANLDKINF